MSTIIETVMDPFKEAFMAYSLLKFEGLGPAAMGHVVPLSSHFGRPLGLGV